MSKVLVLVGTKKGAWIYSSDESRTNWELSEPNMPGHSVFSMTLDTRRDTPRVLAASNHWAWGRSVARSDDMGKTWEQRSPGLSFSAESGLSVDNVWGVTVGHKSQPGVLYAGTQPAGLFRSEDWGETWAPVNELNESEHRQFWWMSGGGASCLHTLDIDPRDANRMYASIASGGTYLTKDGGATWALCSHKAIAVNEASRKMMEDFARDFPEFANEGPPVPEGVDPAAANEFHKMRLDPKNPDRIWAQAHIGVFRSDDGAGNWEDVTEGLPSFHGFPIAVTKQGPDYAFVVPLEFQRDNFRVCPGQFAVYRTGDSGRSWERLTNGLPGPHDYQSAYREAMDTDGCENEAVYVGTTNGEVYMGRECGESWERLPGTLPPILSVSAFELD